MKHFLFFIFVTIFWHITTVVGEMPQWNGHYSGGSYDGWDRCAMTAMVIPDAEATFVRFTSGSIQCFDLTDSPFLQPVTIEDCNGEVNRNHSIRIALPEKWLCCFHNTTLPAITGSAINKIGAPEFNMQNRVLEIPVLADFTPGDTLIVSGLRLSHLHLVSHGVIGRLELTFRGGEPCDLYDSFIMAVRGSIWSGGSYDGWDTVVLEGYGDIKAPDKNTMIIIR